MTPAIAAFAQEIVARGMSPVVVARNGVPIGVIGVTDRPKAGAASVVSDLRAQGVSRVAMITGDHEAAARATGSQLGVDDVRSGQLPADKVAAIEFLRRAHGAIAMVGDGINDAPALAAADVGIVMGAMGSDAALETADIALMTDELPKVPYTIRLSHATLANIRVNVAIAIGLKVAFVVLAVAGRGDVVDGGAGGYGRIGAGGRQRGATPAVYLGLESSPSGRSALRRSRRSAAWSAGFTFVNCIPMPAF